MKTGFLPALLGLLMLVLGGMVLVYDSAHAPVHALMSPLIGSFVLGAGAVLAGLNLHERKLI